MADRLRLYGPAECGPDGYPFAWHRGELPIKAQIRELAGHRCERCGHPYRSGEHGSGEWTPCDDNCTHGGPVRYRFRDERWCDYGGAAREGWRSEQFAEALAGAEVQAGWRILTVHHLNGVKWDCRWWNLAALCQRCHLTIQGRVVMERVYPFEHTEWFKPHAAGWYAADYLGEDLTREQTLARLDELLALEHVA